MAQTERYAEQCALAGGQRWKPTMCCRPCGAALIVLGAMIFWAVPTLGFEGTYKAPCEIFYKGDKPFVVTCTIRVGLNRKHVVMLARTPNGKSFRIENGGPDQNEWFLDHKAAEVIKAKQPDPCFQNEKVKVCF
jgi:hypothetical protein